MTGGRASLSSNPKVDRTTGHNKHDSFRSLRPSLPVATITPPPPPRAAASASVSSCSSSPRAPPTPSARPPPSRASAASAASFFSRATTNLSRAPVRLSQHVRPLGQLRVPRRRPRVLDGRLELRRGVLHPHHAVLSRPLRVRVLDPEDDRVQTERRSNQVLARGTRNGSQSAALDALRRRLRGPCPSCRLSSAASRVPGLVRVGGARRKCVEARAGQRRRDFRDTNCIISAVPANCR